MTELLLTERFNHALLLASELHASQLRKGSNVPYISHLLAVASLVIEHGGDEDESIAGLLHDAVEDCGGLPTLERIRGQFGETVADIIMGCTDAYTTPKPPWRERKEAYIAHLNDANLSVLLVSSADKLHNARSILSDYREIGDELWSRFTASKEQTLWYYQSVTEVLLRRRPLPLSNELDTVVSDLERLITQ